MFGGVMVPLVTPLGDHDKVCATGVERLIASVRPAATGLIPALSSGEGWQLDEAQWRDMVTLTRCFAGGLPVLAGIELPSTREAMERAQLARWLEVSAVVVPPPFADQQTHATAASETELILAHLRAVAQAARLPVFLYNEPKLTGRRLRPETLVELCRSGLLVGVKDSSGEVDVTRALVAAETGVPVFQGWEHLCQDTTPGVDGYILPLSNLEPALCRTMLQAPSPTLQAEMLEHCTAHDLLGERWYVGLKRELTRRGVIASDRLVSPGRGDH
jgi:4-hydroxy-tetrahydrodipicolinate synthase